MGEVRHPSVVAKEAIEALAELAACDLTGLTGDEVLELCELTAEAAKRAEATQVAAIDRLDATGSFAPSGARSAAAWVGWRCGLAAPRASALVRCARRLRDLPITEAAVLGGRLTPDHVRVLAEARRVDPEGFATDEAMLVDQAEQQLFVRFERLVRYWIHHHDSDHGDGDAREVHAQRRLDASPSLDGVVFIDGMLDPVGGQIVLRELGRLERELFEADWAEARERLGDAATPQDLARTPTQRRADALQVMAQRSAAKPPGATDARVLLQVLVGHDSLRRLCELSNGTIVTPGQLVPLLPLADVERIVFDSPSRVIDVGVRQRLFTGATRTAIQARDRTCQHPSCTVPAEACDIDHLVPYEDGGKTTQINGECKCPHHHR